MNDIVNQTEVSKYYLYEWSEKSQYDRHSIDGTIVGCSRCCGYCQYECHPGFLTKKQMKEHSCLQKKCFHFISKPVRKPKIKAAEDSSLHEFIKASLSAIDGIKVVRTKSSNANCVAYFVAITNEYNFEQCIMEVKNKYNLSLSFEKLNYDFDMCAKIIYAI